jgi:hypothetical protein
MTAVRRRRAVRRQDINIPPTRHAPPTNMRGLTCPLEMVAITMGGLRVGP